MFSLIVRLIIILVGIVLLMAVVVGACFVVFSVVMISSDCKTEMCRREMLNGFWTGTIGLSVVVLGAIGYILYRWKPWEIPFYLRRKSDRRLEQRRLEEERRAFEERRTAEEEAALREAMDVEASSGTSPVDFSAESEDASRRKD